MKKEGYFLKVSKACKVWGVLKHRGGIFTIVESGRGIIKGRKGGKGDENGKWRMEDGYVGGGQRERNAATLRVGTDILSTLRVG